MTSASYKERSLFDIANHNNIDTRAVGRARRSARAVHCQTQAARAERRALPETCANVIVICHIKGLPTRVSKCNRHTI
jgi:hypothetical protein